MKPLDEPVHICAYNWEWPELYAFEAKRIAEALPPDIAIEHIGSTSVTGMLAKPIIDIMLGMEAHHEQNSVRETLLSLDYEDLGEAGVPGRLYFRRRAATAFNIALVRRGGSIWIANLAFREYLRTHPEAAREYEETKRSAIQSGAQSLLVYSDYKSGVLRRLLDQAIKSFSVNRAEEISEPPQLLNRD